MNSARFALLGMGLVALALPARGDLAHAAGYRGYDKAIPAVGGGDSNPRNIDIVENLGDTVPGDLTFVDGHGQRFALRDVLAHGKPVVLTLGYYRCPLLCNLVHEGLAKAITAAGLRLGEDFVGVAVSIDPAEDPKSANTNRRRLLRRLAESSRADAMADVPSGDPAGWPFLLPSPGSTLEQSDARRLAEAVGFRYFYDPESKQFAHAAAAFILTPSGKISRYLYSVDYDARDLRLAVVEASGGRVGTTIDKVLLTCFKYDPMTRKYTPFVAGFVRIGAGLSGLALLTLLAILWRKEFQLRKQRRLA